MEQPKKITLATLKAFVKKTFPDNLYVKTLSDFDGQVDCVMPTHDEFKRVFAVNYENKRSWDIKGIWFVGESRDYIEAYDDGEFTGYQISNCCGSFILATKIESEVTL